MTIKQALSLHPDAPLLLASVLKKDKAHLFANPEKKLTPLQAKTYKLLGTKRRRGVPAAYLLGHKEFFGLDFLVTPDVLIPRPETELLVELALKHLQPNSYNLQAILDIGTGSGNIIISLANVIARSRPRPTTKQSRIQFFATDISPKALAVARANARRHGVAKKIKFLHGNLLSPFLQATSYKLTPILILANLPYLTPSQIHSNPDLAHEPRSALLAGKNGLKYYRQLFHQIKKAVIARSQQATKQSHRSKRLPRPEYRPRNDITLLLEHDPSQAAKLKKLAKQLLPGKPKLTFHRDLSRRPRVLQIQIPMLS